MAERLPENEFDEIQELKENAEKRNTKKKMFLKGRLQEATKCSKSSHLALQKNNFLDSYYKQITA